MNNRKTQARRDKAMQIKKADRALLRLSRERKELWQMIRDAPLKKLKQPYQRGWVRYFTLTEEAARRKDADRFRALLKYVQAIHYCRQRHFKVRKHWKSKRLRTRKHILTILSVSDALRLKIPEELLSYFMTQKRRPISSTARLWELMLSGYRGPIRVRHSHYYERKVEPYMITHSRVALPEVERRLAEIEFILDQPQNRGRLNNLTSSRSPIWKHLPEECENRKVIRAINKDIDLALQEHAMETLSMTQERVDTPPSLFLFRVENYTFCRHSGTAT